MERRHFLKLAVGIAAGSAALAASVTAAPLAPQPIAGGQLPPARQEELELRAAIASSEEADRLKPEQVRWGHHWHHHWRRRWHHWHRRHW